MCVGAAALDGGIYARKGRAGYEEASGLISRRNNAHVARPHQRFRMQVRRMCNTQYTTLTLIGTKYHFSRWGVDCKG